jgi:hypothetical protein
VSLRDLYEAYSDRVQFLLIYIREAHPTDGWYIGAHNIRDPQSIKERRRVAGECEVGLQYGIRTYVDEMDDEVMKAYAAWPDRLYLIGLDGRVVYAGKQGPMGFRPGRLKKAIDALLAGSGSRQGRATGKG